MPLVAEKSHDSTQGRRSQMGPMRSVRRPPSGWPPRLPHCRRRVDFQLFDHLRVLFNVSHDWHSAATTGISAATTGISTARQPKEGDEVKPGAQ
ncbi:hypothetical protein AAVH_09751 [Aphelenchoides avenae]|nr:hypothetical protein AAVH_09751 [Aphelenchus avenae]